MKMKMQLVGGQTPGVLQITRSIETSNIQSLFLILLLFLSSSNPMLLFIAWSDDKDGTLDLLVDLKQPNDVLIPTGSLLDDSFGSFTSLPRN
jgi:hypothetical protein